jgi:amidase
MSQLGPMARNVGDLALLLAAIAGPDARDPLSIDTPFSPDIVGASLTGVRVAWSQTVDGLPIEPVVTEALGPARQALQDAGAEVTDQEPDLTGADEVFETFRSLAYWQGMREHAAAGRRELVKEEVLADARRGEALSVDEVLRAADLRTEIFRRTSALLERFDLLALPTVQVVPFDVGLRWPTDVAGIRMERYYTWMRSCSRITSTTLPALSLPAGFTPEGLPVGLQLIGRHRGEGRLLSLAAALEARLDAGAREPVL